MTKTILLVEDSPDDVFLLQRAFKQAGYTQPLQVAADGQQAVDYLSGKKGFVDRAKYPLPAIILLDLKLPQMPGLDVLAWIRANKAVATTPVVVLTSSRQESDIVTAQQRGANAFVVKPTASDQRLEFAKHLIGFWLNFNERPPHARS
jgi:DNA-binding response OmpR family regulator